MNRSLPAFLILLLGMCQARAEFDLEEYKNQYDEAVRIAARYPLREFEKAVEDGDVKTVTRLLLEHGARVNAVNRDGETPLHCSNNAAITRPKTMTAKHRCNSPRNLGKPIV